MATIPSYRTPAAARERLIALCGDVQHLHVLDVGCGNGAIGRALLPQVGPEGSVTFVDQDSRAIDRLAAELAGSAQAFARVDDACALGTVAGESIDLVVMRAVLLYIPDKRAALRAAARVLRPHGRIVLSEPVNRPLYHPAERLWGFDLTAIPAIAGKLQRGFTEHASAAVSAMGDWDDVDLAAHASAAGFSDIRMETVTEVSLGPALAWLPFFHSRWTPWMPSMADIVRATLSAEERAAFETVVRPQLTAGAQRLILRNTFLTARLLEGMEQIGRTSND